MNFEAKRIVREYTMRIDASPDRVFPLLCPRREYEWIPDWKSDIVFSESGFAERDCVFTTVLPGGGIEVWCVDEYVENSRIGFVRVSDDRVIRMTIECIVTGENASNAVWRQIVTSRNSRGNQFIESYTEEVFSRALRLREEQLRHFVGNGTMISGL